MMHLAMLVSGYAPQPEPQDQNHTAGRRALSLPADELVQGRGGGSSRNIPSVANSGHVGDKAGSMEGTFLCPGQSLANYCDCSSDCGTSFCQCPKAKTCCEGSPKQENNEGAADSTVGKNDDDGPAWTVVANEPQATHEPEVKILCDMEVCHSSNKDWEQKCSWKATCSECAECEVALANEADDCETWCLHSAKSWDVLCGFKETCGGCDQCPPPPAEESKSSGV